MYVSDISKLDIYIINSILMKTMPQGRFITKHSELEFFLKQVLDSTDCRMALCESELLDCQEQYEILYMESVKKELQKSKELEQSYVNQLKSSLEIVIDNIIRDSKYYCKVEDITEINDSLYFHIVSEHGENLFDLMFTDSEDIRVAIKNFHGDEDEETYISMDQDLLSFLKAVSSVIEYKEYLEQWYVKYGQYFTDRVLDFKAEQRGLQQIIEYSE